MQGCIKNRYAGFTGRVILFFLLLLVISSPAFAESAKAAPTLSITEGVWDESGMGSNLNYTFFYTTIDYDKINFRYDTFSSKQLQRYWLHYGKFHVVNGKNFKMIVSPGMMCASNGKTYIGGNVKLDFPKLGLDISQRSYGANHTNAHYTYANLKLAPYAGVQYYRLAKIGARPESFIGPKVMVGKDVVLWYAFSTNIPGGRAANVTVNFKF